MNYGTHGLVKEHFRNMQVSSAGVCAQMTGLEPAEVCAEMKVLIREKRLQQVPDVPDLYQYCNHVMGAGLKPAPTATPEQIRMWWAMNLPHNAPSNFTVFLVAQLAGVSQETVRGYLRLLCQLKYVKRTGSVGASRKGFFRVMPGAPAPDSPPINGGQGSGGRVQVKTKQKGEA